MKCIHRLRITFFFLIVSVALSSCTPDKARSLRLAAIQFKAESIAAIEAIEAMHRRELELPPQLQADARENFINGVLDSRIEINHKNVELLTTLNRSPAPEWAAFVADLSNQYEQFAAIYSDLESGSFLATKAVKKSAEPAQILTVQMALFAKEISENPPQLYRYRTAIVVELRKLQKQYQQLVANQASAEEIQQLRNQVGKLMDEWQQVESEEQELLNTTIAQCTKAAMLGADLSELIDRYNKLDIDELNGLIATILENVSSITGQDYSQLQLKVNAVNSAINQDAVLKRIADRLVNQIQNVVDRRSPPAMRSPQERSTSQEIRQLKLQLLWSRQQ
jgi:hypothetical protein